MTTNDGKDHTTEDGEAATAPNVEQLWAQCQEIALRPRILDYLASELERGGLVGEQRAAKLVYLVLSSRLLQKPICSSIKGPSSAGKNYVASHVLRLFPATAYYRMTSMSPRLLAYSEEPLVHRILVLEEAAGLGAAGPVGCLPRARMLPPRADSQHHAPRRYRVEGFNRATR